MTAQEFQGSAQTGDGGALNPPSPDRLKLTPLEIAGKRAIDETMQMLKEHPNMAFFGLKDSTGKPWKITPLFNEKKQYIEALTFTRRNGRGTRLAEAYQVIVGVDPVYRVSHANNDNPGDTGSADFPQLIQELFPPVPEPTVIPNLTPEKYRMAIEEIKVRLTALGERRPGLSKTPDSRAPEKELETRRQRIFKRFQRILDVDPHGIPPVEIYDKNVSGFVAWGMEPELDKGNNIVCIEIHGQEQREEEARELNIFLPEVRFPSDPFVSVDNWLDSEDGFSIGNSELCMQIAEEYSDAFLTPLEDMLGLPPLAIEPNPSL